MVLSADRDGLPLVNLVDRLSEEARRQRQRDTDIRIRQVPARLTFPLVFCILPSFIVLTMFPIVSSSFTSLQLPLSDTAIITYSTEQP
jgi:tight adherence protein C